MMMAAGLEGEARAWIDGRNVEMPCTTPKRFVSIIW